MRTRLNRPPHRTATGGAELRGRAMGRGGPLRRLWPAVALVLAWAAPAAAQETKTIRTRTVYEDLQMFSQVLNQIRINHPDSIDTHALFMAAVEGLVRAADPHSYVLPATRLAPEKERELRAGKLIPVPIAFRYFGGSPVVVSVAPGSEAARLDILPGDELVAADGKPITAESADELRIQLAGPKGSTVALEFERRRADGSLARLERTVKRERAEAATAVPTAFLYDDATGYVRVTTFANETAANDLHAALARLEREGMRRLILDLRDNGGGLVDEATRIAGEFLPKGTLVYTSSGRKKELVDTVRVQRSFWKSERRYPIVVLVNDGTASASELVAGALQDHDRALIVGRPTFGKALIMQGFPLSDGSIMVLVVGEIRTPCGRTVQREYRSIRSRDYYRGTAEERAVADRPTCTTASGRTVYGGGGIYPDVVLPETPTPTWLARVHEENLPLRWVGGFLDGNPSLFSTAEALARDPSLPAEAIRQFREFAEEHGVEIPEGDEADTRLRHALVLRIASAKWGAEGYYRVAAALDPEIEAAAAAFPRAEEILAARP